MRLLLSVARRILDMRSGETRKAELSEELQFHIDRTVEQNKARGMTEHDAIKAARESFGSVTAATEESYRSRGTAWFDDFKQDCRYGLRTLLKHRSFSLLTVLTLALGIGACTAIFSIVEAVLLHSLPYGDPEKLVYLFTPSAKLLQMGVPPDVFPASFADFIDLKRESRSFVGMTLFQQTNLNLSTGTKAERVGVARVDGSFFNTMQVTPELGRAINPADEDSGSGQVAVISQALWQSMFAKQSNILGKTLKLDGANYQVVGVMPTGFDFPSKSDIPAGFGNIARTQIWVASDLSAKQLACRDGCGAFVIARLKLGTSLHQSQAELNTFMPQINSLHDPAMHDYVAYLKPLRDVSVGPVQALMRMLLGAVCLVLLIACGNAANLLLARAANRTHEFGVRVTLGAVRGRLIRQLLTESLLLGAASGLVGAVLAWLFLHWLLSINPGDIPRMREAQLNLSALGFLICVTIVTSLLFGVLPSFVASRVSPARFLKMGGVRGIVGDRRSIRRALAISQVATVMILLSGAGLLLRSYAKVLAAPVGLSPSTLTANIQFSSQLDGVKMNPHYSTPEKRQLFLTGVLDTVGNRPGVQAAGWIDILPLSRSESMVSLEVQDHPQQQYPWVESRRVSGGYFTAAQIPLKRGRGFSGNDGTHNLDQVVVNEAFVDQFFGKTDAIGQHVRFSPQGPWLAVIGVLSDVRNTGPEIAAAPQIYSSIWADSLTAPVNGGFLVIRSALPAAAVVSDIRQAIRILDPDLAVSDIQTFGNLISEASAQRRFQALLLTMFGVVALFLAVIGVYGLLAYMVRQRIGEIGIRMALGSSRMAAAGLVLREAMVLLAAGLGIGLVGSLGFTRALSGFLFDVPRLDPITYAAVALVLTLGNLTACLVPGLRASRIDPMKALRCE